MTIKEYETRIKGTLERLKRYDSALDPQISSLAGVMRTQELANAQIDTLEEVTVLEETRYGSKLAPHPAFKVQRDAQDAVTRQMKALGLTPEDLAGEVETDPLVSMTAELRDMAASRKVKPSNKAKK